jgi:hypothetical protein
MCIKGHRIVLDVFDKIKEPGLAGLIVWGPMIPGDCADEAAKLVTSERRLIVQAWDGKRSLGRLWSRTLHLHRPAWDVYLVYVSGVKWEGDLPPMPSFWMHQMGQRSGADPALYLDAAKFEQAVRHRLAGGA